jgi:HK97 family phage prohead protease
VIQRAWSQFTVKGMDDKRRRFSGIASTPSTDRMGDVVEPKGAQFKLPIPFLWQHDSKDPIGWITSAKVTDKGIEVEGEVANVDEAGPLRDRLLTAWQMLKAGIVRGLSIGFNASESEPIKGTYGLRFKKWEWLELSAVTIAANQDASILAIKSIDTAMQAASGRTHGDPTPAVVGTKQPATNGGFFVSQPQSKQVKTIAELRTERETKAARMGELMQLKKAGDGFGDAERAEYDAVSNEVDSLDDDIRELKFHAVNSANSRAVEGTTQRSGVASRGRTLPTTFGIPDEKFAGQYFTQKVIAKALAANNYVSAGEVAAQRYKSNPLLVEVIKADVAGGGSGSGEWGAELVSADNRFTGDFIKFLHSKTVFDSLPLRPVPANVTIKGEDGAATANWVGESKAIPASAVDYSTVSLTPQKVAALAVVSNELLRDSSPSAEMLVRDALVEASAQKVDTHFFSTTAASAGVYPAGILNGVVVGTTGGATEAELIGDIAGLMRNFITAKYDVDKLVWCMGPLLALQIQLMRNTLGQNAFATMPNTLEGRPVYSGHNVSSGDLILMSPGDIWKIGDGGVQVSISREATIEQDSAPQGATDTPVTMSTKFTNMFQAESTAIKVVRSINWQKRRTGAVHYIGNATYGELQSV